MDENEKRTVWITKYALTQGLFQVEAELVPVTDEPGEFYASTAGSMSGLGLFTREWVATEQEARDVWEKKRLKKVASLKKQLAKLDAMPVKFKAP